jgi:hypothetical protein
LQASDIAEECGEDEGLIVSTIKEMIVNEEIYAKYFENSKSVAFDQRVIERERLRNSRSGWTSNSRNGVKRKKIKQEKYSISNLMKRIYPSSI